MSVMRYRTAPVAGSRAGRALFRTSPVDAKNLSATRRAVDRSSGGQTGSSSRISRIARSVPGAAPGGSARTTPVSDSLGEGHAHACSGSRGRLAVRHQIREALSKRQRQGDRDPVERRAQVCEDGRDGGSSGHVVHEDVALAVRIPAIPPRGVVGDVGRHDDRVAIQGDVAVGERDVALDEHARSESSAGVAGEDGHREPGRLLVGVAADEGEHEVEDAVVVGVAPHEVGMVDAVERGHVFAVDARPVVLVGRRPQVRVETEEGRDRGLLGGTESVGRVLDGRGRRRFPRDGGGRRRSRSLGRALARAESRERGEARDGHGQAAGGEARRAGSSGFARREW